MVELKEDDIVLCTVERISGTTVFVKIEDNGDGTIITSEIAPGRIRNIRDYVVPGKKIACKILSIDKAGNIHLSLRRITDKEKREVMDKYQKEKSSLSILKSVVKEKAEEIAEDIKKESTLYDFLQKCKVEPKKLEKYLEKEDAAKICKILQERKGKEVEVKKDFKLSSQKPNGLIVIKQILSKYKNIAYLGAGKYCIKIKAENYKIANQQVQKILDEIEQNAEKQEAEFEVK